MSGKILLIILMGVLLFSCNPKVVKQPPVQQKKQVTLETLPDTLYITASSENVRLSPNGEYWGKINKGDILFPIRRMGNWLNFNSDRFDSAFVWAPSTGLEYLNLYHPDTYFDSTTNAFRSVTYFQSIFGEKGQKRQEGASAHQLFFGDIGLGSHQEVVIEVVTEQKSTVNNGVTVFVNDSTGNIFKVKVDFYQPIEGLKNALKKCELPNLVASENNEGHVIWSNGQFNKSLIVDMERKEWKSNLFTSIWFIGTNEQL